MYAFQHCGLRGVQDSQLPESLTLDKVFPSPIEQSTPATPVVSLGAVCPSKLVCEQSAPTPQVSCPHVASSLARLEWDLWLGPVELLPNLCPAFWWAAVECQSVLKSSLLLPQSGLLLEKAFLLCLPGIHPVLPRSSQATLLPALASVCSSPGLEAQVSCSIIKAGSLDKQVI